MINPIAMRPVRVCFIQVLGRLWMGGVGATEYTPTDRELHGMKEWTRKSVSAFLKVHGGDFQSITDYRACCGNDTVDWADESNEAMFNDIMPPY